MSDIKIQKHSASHKATKNNPHSDHPNHRQWIAEFIRTLFDFSFSEVITLKMLPLLYGVALIACLAAALLIFMNTASQSLWRGILYLIFVAPIFFIFAMAAIRSLLEFFSAVFRMQTLMVDMNKGLEGLEHYMEALSGQMHELNHHITQMSHHMEHMRKDFSTVMEVMENIEDLTDRIPFIKKPRKQTREQWAESSLPDRPESTAPKAGDPPQSS